MPVEQKNKKKSRNKNELDLYNDEIDLFELFQKIWKWKWLTIALMVIICCITFFYVNTKPETYTITSTIRIGKIGDVMIEEIQEIQAYLESGESQQNKTCSQLLVASVIAPKSNIIKITCTSDSSDLCYSCLEKSIYNLINRHNIIYNKALKKFNDNIAFAKTKIIIEPKYILDTYTFPSSIAVKPEKSVNPDNKRLSLKIAVAFIASFFIGIFLSFFIEYILAHRNKT